MFINWGWLRYIGIFVLIIFKMIMWIFGFIIILILVVYLIYSYEKVVDIKTNFKKAQSDSLTLFQFLDAGQTPILQYRKRPNLGDYYYVLSYQLNAQQYQTATLYLNSIVQSIQKKSSRNQMDIVKIENSSTPVTCIEVSTDTKWLFPSLSRHYVGKMDSEYKEWGSFLVYGSSRYLHQLEQVCTQHRFRLTHLVLMNSKFDSVQLTLDPQQKIMMLNYHYYLHD